MALAIVVVGLLVLWIAINLKTSRADGVLVGKVHPYRTLMQYIMPTRNESVVFFDTYVKADSLLEYVAEARKRFHVDISHCLVAAAGIGLNAVPQMNQFVVGRRIYQRNQVEVTFSMKRRKMNAKAKLSTVKMALPDGQPFSEVCQRINDKISGERSGERTYADKEFDLFTRIPRALMVRLVKLFGWLDYHNLLPNSFIKHDGMYTSLFIANLGSLKMGAGYHHLYEWGNCPLFMMVGQIEDRPAVVDGQVVPQKTLHIRWTYDERIDDGLTARFGIDAVKRGLENPVEAFGALDADAGDADQPAPEDDVSTDQEAAS